MSQFSTILPSQRLIMPYTRVKREVLLPNNLVGTVLVRRGQQVDPHTIIARGNRTTQHHVIDCAEELGLRRKTDLADLLQIKIGDVVEKDEVLAGQDIKRGKRSFSPVAGQVVAIEDGTVIIRQTIESVELLAGMRGVVTDVRPGRGIVMETIGALLQGVWGNNRRAVGSLRLEPERGIEMLQGSTLQNEWSGTIMVTRRPIKAITLLQLDQLRISGLIAPSMDSTLMNVALQLDQAILLTEGFGEMRMSNVVQSMITRFEKSQVTLDAVLPSLTESRRPEALIAVRGTERANPREPLSTSEVRVGTPVRVIREPYQGQTGKIVEVGRSSIPLANGLRVPIALVEMPSGDIEPIPMTNLEIFT